MTISFLMHSVFKAEFFFNDIYICLFQEGRKTLAVAREKR